MAPHAGVMLAHYYRNTAALGMRAKFSWAIVWNDIHNIKKDLRTGTLLFLFYSPNPLRSPLLTTRKRTGSPLLS